MRKLPRKDVKADVETTTRAVKDKKEIHKEHGKFTTVLLVKPGVAGIKVTHGKKYWCNTQVDGLSVESTCTVSLKCAQEKHELDKANEQASKFAWDYMRRNFKRVEEDIREFLETDPKND